MRFDEAFAHRVVARMLTRPDHGRSAGMMQHGMMHGGALMAFADTLGGALCIVNVNDTAAWSTLECKVNVVRPVPIGSCIVGECELVHRGRRTIVSETRVYDETDRALLALVTQTQLLLEDASVAQGRGNANID